MMSPRVKVVLIEAAVTIGTGAALYLMFAYAPVAIEAGTAAWRRRSAPALPMYRLNEQAVSDFRATLSEPIPDLLQAENWGW